MDARIAQDLHGLHRHIRLLERTTIALIQLAVTMANDLAALDAKIAELKQDEDTYEGAVAAAAQAAIDRATTDKATIDSLTQQVADLKAAAAAGTDTTPQIAAIQAVIDQIIAKSPTPITPTPAV